jgi:hypothetical protein
MLKDVWLLGDGIHSSIDEAKLFSFSERLIKLPRLALLLDAGSSNSIFLLNSSASGAVDSYKYFSIWLHSIVSDESP